MSFPRLAIFAIAISSFSAHAQPEQSSVPYIPEEESPFFVIRDPTTPEGTRRDRRNASPSASFPMNKTSVRSAGNMLTGFFTEMFDSVDLSSDRNKTGSKLAIDPEEFSLDDRREVAVTFSVHNRTNKILKLEFPTSQRLEILVRDPAGAVIERWSDDRAFDEEVGVVMINPDERIEYEEKIATREMTPGTSYTIEASLANNPDFTKSRTVVPSGKLELPPAPIPGEAEAPADQQASGEPEAGSTQG
ncbi:MAG: BsuPI-related putative proteinase inhibitor [Chthoniobacterales bacterium]